MAYIKDLISNCSGSGCIRRATKEVIDHWNGSCGKFCSTCAKRKLKEVLAYERSKPHPFETGKQTARN